MSVSVTLNGLQYTIPQTDEDGWGSNVTGFIQAVATGTLQKTGGTFTLTADVDFGGTYGLVSTYFTSRTSNAASAGAVRLARADGVKWRNEANDANLTLGVDSSNNLEWEGVDVVTVSGTQTLTNKTISGASNTLSNIGISSLYPVYWFAHGSSTSCASGVSTNIVWTTETLDNRTAFDGTSFTCPAGQDGVYLVSAQVTFESAAYTEKAFVVQKNASTVFRASNQDTNSIIQTQTISGLVQLAAGDTITVQGYQTNGGSAARTVNAGGSGLSYFSGVRVA